MFACVRAFSFPGLNARHSSPQHAPSARRPFRNAAQSMSRMNSRLASTSKHALENCKTAMTLPVPHLALAAALTASALHAENWPQWRGPHLNGSAKASNLPASLDKAAATWIAPMPGKSGATPIIWDDHVFVSTPDAQKNLVLLAINRRDGKVLWEKQVAVGDREQGRNNMASPSPVTDGRHVFAMFATGDLVAFDFKGNTVWSRNLAKDFGKFAIMWIYGSSPVLHDGRLYLQVLQRDDPSDYAHAQDGKPTRESYVLALDARTGKDLWRHVRKTDSTKESQESYATPLPYKGAAGWELLVVGGDHLSAHKLSDGAELWRARLYEKRDDWYRIVTSPVAADGLIYASGPKGQPVVAFQDGGSGDVTTSKLAWKFTEAPSDCPTPLLYDGRLYVLEGNMKKERVLSCLNPKTGEKRWSATLPANDPIWASPTGADGKIYLVSEKGSVFVVAAGDEFKLLSRLDLDESPTRASVAISGRQIFVRTARNLYCFGAH